ncbi:hypothetical protein WJX82_005504 [Trebouxia sp. C0006]
MLSDRSSDDKHARVAWSRCDDIASVTTIRSIDTQRLTSNLESGRNPPERPLRRNDRCRHNNNASSQQ